MFNYTSLKPCIASKWWKSFLKKPLKKLNDQRNLRLELLKRIESMLQCWTAHAVEWGAVGIHGIFAKTADDSRKTLITWRDDAWQRAKGAKWHVIRCPLREGCNQPVLLSLNFTCGSYHREKPLVKSCSRYGNISSIKCRKWDVERFSDRFNCAI